MSTQCNSELLPVLPCLCCFFLFVFFCPPVLIGHPFHLWHCLPNVWKLSNYSLHILSTFPHNSPITVLRREPKNRLGCEMFATIFEYCVPHSRPGLLISLHLIAWESTFFPPHHAVILSKLNNRLVTWHRYMSVGSHCILSEKRFLWGGNLIFYFFPIIINGYSVPFLKYKIKRAALKWP